MLPRGVTTALTILIGLVWAGNVIVGFIDPSLRDPMINAIFAIVAGSVYALGRNGNSRTRGVRRRIANAIAGEDAEGDENGSDAPAQDTDREVDQ